MVMEGNRGKRMLELALSSINNENVAEKIVQEVNSMPAVSDEIIETDAFEQYDDSDKDKDFDPNEKLCNTSDTSTENIDNPIKAGRGLKHRKKRSRWNKADKSRWCRYVAKKRRNLGLPYVTRNGKMPAKVPKYINCTNCKFKCSQNFSEEDRVNLCLSYWRLESFCRKKDFILQNIKSFIPQRQRLRKESGKARTNSKQFYFLKNGTPVRICQTFFLKTLSISNGALNKALANRDRMSGLYQGEDKRGKHEPANKLSPEEKQTIKDHIETFPVTESDYCRKSSQRKYLDAILSIAKMYSLYKEMCAGIGKIPRSMTTNKRIFCQEYNFSFFKPSKDQCPLCVKYNGATTEQKVTLQSTYEEHKQREADANNSKMCDKERASADSSFVTVTFDLQSVLQIPCSDISPMYYSRKLCGYNLTIYEGAPPNNAHCFAWTEVNGARGSLEIGTCLYLYLKALPEHVKEVSLFSDTCGGQNRNQNVLIMIYYFVHHESSNIAVIEQKFLEQKKFLNKMYLMYLKYEAIIKLIFLNKNTPFHYTADLNTVPVKDN